MTQTQGPQWFGSGVTVPGTGVIFNNGMMLYSPDPKAANSIEQGKRGRIYRPAYIGVVPIRGQLVLRLWDINDFNPISSQ